MMEQQADTRQVVNFAFYKVDRSWRLLPEDARARGRQQFLEAVEKHLSQVATFSYSTVGIRADTDFLLWRVTDKLDNLEAMSADLLKTDLGRYLETPYSYLAITKRSTYVDTHQHEGQEGTRLQVQPGNQRYLFVYPFVKTREWYRLTKAARQGMMTEHFEVGHRFPTVKLNTTYSFGLDDQEWVVAFETDSLGDFQDLVMELRHIEASRFTERDTPIFTCIRHDLPQTIELLG